MNIYITMKNSDMTEGRGHMVIDEVFLKKEDAEKYIDGQPGVMGRMAKWSREKYGDWTIQEVVAHSSLLSAIAMREHKEKQTALSKLTNREKQLLGLN